MVPQPKKKFLIDKMETGYFLGVANNVNDERYTFERYVAEYRVQIKYYLADNDIFRAHKWVDDRFNRDEPQGNSYA